MCLGRPLELGQPDLGQAPEAFDAVDMDGAFGELVAGMVDADVAIAEVEQVLAFPESAQVAYRAVRQAKVRGFPYSLHFL